MSDQHCAGADDHVIKATDPLDLSQVRRLMRRVAPSDDGFGTGPNALLMSRRTRDDLISLVRNFGSAPSFLPDPLNAGRFRFHFDGVPVYVGRGRAGQPRFHAPSSPETAVGRRLRPTHGLPAKPRLSAGSFFGTPVLTGRPV